MKTSFFILLNIVFLQFSTTTVIAAPKDLLHLQYASDKQNTLDLFLPTTYSQTTPVIILLHGGAWMMGGNEYTDKSAKDLRNRGFIVANVDYRYVSAAVHGKDLLTDIDKALDYVQAKSKEYHFRSEGYHMSGISAGAHLALLYGYTSQKNIKSIITLCAPTRLDDVQTLNALPKNNLLKNVEFLADAKYTPGSKIDRRFTAVSPYAHVKSIPTLLFHGDKDELVSYTQSQFLYKILKRKNLVAKFVTMEGKGHDCGMNQPDTEKRVLDEIVRWVTVYDKFSAPKNI